MTAAGDAGVAAARELLDMSKGRLIARYARLSADLAAARAGAEAKDRRIAELEEALEIALAEPCASCGIKVTLPCPRSANASRFREFHGGSRAARTAGGSDGRS